MEFKFSRIDLADVGSPHGLVSEMLKIQGDWLLPTPIEELCHHLDILEIAELKTNGYEGGLLTDTDRSSGIILVNMASPKTRRRFTIAHELGHFLMPSHLPSEEGRFLCSRNDLSLLSTTENDRRGRMEVDANRFAALILMPPPIIKKRLSQKNTPSLEHLFELNVEFGVSKEAMARTYSDFHVETLAFLIIYKGKVQTIYRDRKRFPNIHVRSGQSVPVGSLYHSKGHSIGQPSELDSRISEIWIDPIYQHDSHSLTEQVCMLKGDYALIMLWYEFSERDASDERTAKQRLDDRVFRA